MKRKNARVSQTAIGQLLLLSVFLLALTVLRTAVATHGAMNQNEAFLSVCAAHPAGGYVEGPAGVPLLLALLKVFSISGLPFLRVISPLFALILSWSIWWIGRHVAPHRASVALWAVLGVNLLPPVNLAALTIDGAMVSASLILLAIVAGWHASQSQGKEELKAWGLFGFSLAITTLFFQPVGWLLLLAMIFHFVSHGVKSIPWRGLIASTSLLALAWVSPVAWNARHDWIQWSSIASGFDFVHFGRFSCSLTLLVLTSSLVVPFLVRLAYSGRWWRGLILFIALLFLGASSLILLLPSSIPAGLPSPIGVQGTEALSEVIVSLRDSRTDIKGNKSFLIASSPGLAALLGERILIDYREQPGAPSVFAAESPSINSSFALWPNYADAISVAAKDPFYTEEKFASPFLGRNALYITSESKEDLPQTITGAFGLVELLKEVPLNWNGRQVVVKIYLCEEYRSLAL